MSDEGSRFSLRRATGGASTLPLAVLFALNLVDEFDQVALGILAPEIRDTFDLTDTEFTSIVTLAGALVILLIVPVGVVADRYNRVRMTGLAALAWGSMSVLTGVAGFVGFLPLLILARFGSGLGRVMNEPVHASLLADFYPPAQHGRVFSYHRMANPIGLLLVLVAGVLAELFGWRMTFVLLALPTAVAVLFVARLKEPPRGASVDLALAMEGEKTGDKVSFGEAFRRLGSIRTLKRTWTAAFLLGAAVIPITVFFNFFYEKVYNIESEGPWGRAGITAIYGVGAIVGLLLGSRLSTSVIAQGRIDRLAALGGATLVSLGGALLLMAVSPWLGLSIFFTFLAGVVGAGFLSYHLPLVALVSPARLRSQAFAWFGFWFGLGAILLAAVVSGIGDNQGYRWGITVLAAGVLVSGVIYASATRFVNGDMEQAFNSLSVEADLRRMLEEGGARSLLVCRGVDVAYGQTQVLFGVNFEVAEGEIVALLGTNGAGKSTLLNAVCGLVEPSAGAIVFAGRDISRAPANETAARGIVMVPGGKGVFPTLSVGENLDLAGWLYQKDKAHVEKATRQVLEYFPILRTRWNEKAGNLSGGEQQMLTLGQAFIAQPRLMMIDELSLGLAPVIVEQLLGIVRAIHDRGTTVILVEQSVNVAITLASRAVFMEKGEVRFDGPTAELLERPDILRAVFLEGTASVTDGKKPAEGTAADVVRNRQRPSFEEHCDSCGRDHGVILETKSLSVRFGGIRAVSDVDLTVREGQILGLIGPNGAGKTTIFDLISGFLKPDPGRVLIDGEDVTLLGPDGRALRGLGRSFQDARLFPSLTVYENLAVALERHIPTRDPVAAALVSPATRISEKLVAERVGELIDLMNLGAFANKFVSELSTGSRRVVDLACSLAHGPRVLLLDEPSSGIAQRETEALGPLLLDIRDRTGAALLVVEHDMPLITGISDEIVALELGSIIAQGTPDEVISDPRVVESYLGGTDEVIFRSGEVASSNGARKREGNRSARRRREPLRAGGRSSSGGAS